MNWFIGLDLLARAKGCLILFKKFTIHPKPRFFAAVGMYGGGKPGDRPSLSFQFLPYHISDVNFFHKKCREQIFIFLEGLEYLKNQ
ncbi:MAG: hypothetical protein II575_06040 [Bacteroidales bacterium]|nr:hypothetical protein [Bacteroidales bacterium]